MQDRASGAIKERQRRIWTSGDYARIGNSIAILGELLCEAVDLRSGQSVLDVATGSDNTAFQTVSKPRIRPRRSAGVASAWHLRGGSLVTAP